MLMDSMNDVLVAGLNHGECIDKVMSTVLTSIF